MGLYNNHILIRNIQERRKDLHLKISDLARVSGVSDKTLRKIIDGTTANPTIGNVNRLATALRCSTSELIGETKLLNLQERNVLGNFRDLNDENRRAVENFIELCLDMQRTNARVIRQLPLFDQKVSAGLGSYLDSESYEYINVPEEDLPPTKGFALQVTGDSMEPLLSDQDYVYIQPTQSIENGDIGVFVLDGDSYIKKYQSGKLISLNEEYKPIDLKKYDQVYTIGKYIKKIHLEDDYYDF